MKVLVTGSNGFFGTNIVEVISPAHTVFGVNRGVPKASNCDRTYIADINDVNRIDQLVGELQIEAIVHAAAKPIVGDCAKDPHGAFMTNTLGTASILEAARRNKVQKVIIIETDKVYGEQEVGTKVNEQSLLNPGSPYEISKVLGADIIQFYRDHYGMKIIQVRPVNLFGPHDYSFSRLVPNLMRSVIHNKPVIIHEEAKYVYRDFIYAPLAASSIKILLEETPRHGVYNLSVNDQPKTIPTHVQEFCDLLGYDNIEYQQKGTTFSEIDYQSIDGTRFIEEFDVPRINYKTESQVRATLQWYELNA